MKNKLFFSFDIRAKLIFTLLFSFVPFFCSRLEINILLSLLFSLFTLSQLGLKKTASIFRLILPIIALMTILLPFQGRGGEVYLRVFNLNVITEGALKSYLKVLSRFITLSLLFSLLLNTSSEVEIIPAMLFFHIPYSGCLTFMMTIRFIPFLTNVYGEIRDSMKLRRPNPGEDEKKRIRVFDIIPTLTSLLVVSLKSISTTSIALELRGYDGNKKRTYYRRLKNVKNLYLQFLLSVIVPILSIILVMEI